MAIRSPEHTVVVPKDIINSADRWCEEQFGERWNAITNRSGMWTVFWAGPTSPKSYNFHFSEEQDRLLFILRWL